MTPSCSILWYPAASHVDLVIDDAVYNPFLTFTKSAHTVLEQTTRSLQGNGAPFYRFQLWLTAEEKEEMLRALPHMGPHICSGNIARLISKVTGISFPRFKSWLPSTFAEHLYQTRNGPHSRFLGVESIGYDPDESNLIRAFQEGYWEDLRMGASLAFSAFEQLGEMARGEAI